jgi:hypothetical protein
MKPTNWGKEVDESARRDQFKLIYDYIKFHIGLYLSTPAALALIADGLGVKQTTPFALGIIAAMGFYLPAGIHAALFMARNVNDPWQRDYVDRFEREAFSSTRRTMHHTLYWAGLTAGLGGLIFAWVKKVTSPGG